MARMVYIRQINPHTFLHFTTDGPSFRLRDYSRSPYSPPREVKRQKRGKPSLTADDIRTMAEQPGNYNLELPESGRDLKDVEFWHKTTIHYNKIYLSLAKPLVQHTCTHARATGTETILSPEGVPAMRKCDTYEEVAAYLLDRFAAEFGLDRVEGKQPLPGHETGTTWVIDAKGVRESDGATIIVKCRRYTTSKAKQEQLAAPCLPNHRHQVRRRDLRQPPRAAERGGESCCGEEHSQCAIRPREHDAGLSTSFPEHDSGGAVQ